MATARTLAGIRVLAREVSPDPAAWPTLTVVIPACDEAESIGHSLGTLLRQDYPALDIVAIDDRSTDATGAILDSTAEHEPRLKAIHVRDLPEDWLGKVHALHQGTQTAKGEWLLFADADVQFSPGALKRAVAYAEARHLDLLTALPEVLPLGLLGDAAYGAGLVMVAGLASLWKVRDPSSKAIAGVGAFILVRRAAFDRTPGFAWLRLEVADDMGLGLLLKHHGGRCDVVNGVGLFRLQWYASFGDMAGKMQKNYFAILSQFSLTRAAVMAILLAWSSLFPLALLLPGSSSAGVVVTTVGWTSLLGVSVALAIWTRRNVGPALLVQVGLLASAWLLLRSAWIGRRIGGIAWRGKLYPTALLAGSQRVKL